MTKPTKPGSIRLGTTKPKTSVPQTTPETEPEKDPDELPNTIDELMAIDPLELSKRSPKAYEKYIAGVIAYHRNQRAAREAGGTKTRSATTTKVTNEQLKALLQKAAPKKPNSPVGTGIRRI